MSEQDYLKKIKELEEKNSFYENGDAKLYYALQRKMSEMSQILNNISLTSLALDDKNDKTFERIKVIWTDSKVISETAKILGEAAGVTGDEKKDTSKKGSFLDKFVN
jgi:hypothetical protein